MRGRRLLAVLLTAALLGTCGDDEAGDSSSGSEATAGEESTGEQECPCSSECSCQEDPRQCVAGEVAFETCSASAPCCAEYYSGHILYCTCPPGGECFWKQDSC